MLVVGAEGVKLLCSGNFFMDCMLIPPTVKSILAIYCLQKSRRKLSLIGTKQQKVSHYTLIHFVVWLSLPFLYDSFEYLNLVNFEKINVHVQCVDFFV